MSEDLGPNSEFEPIIEGAPEERGESDFVFDLVDEDRAPQETTEAVPAPELPAHLEAALGGLLGNDWERYRNPSTSPDECRQIIMKHLTPDLSDSSPEITPVGVDIVLQRLMEQSTNQLQAGFLSVEGASDALTRVMAVTSNVRRLGANKISGALGITGGALATVGTGMLLRKAETVAVTGGAIGGVLSVLGYQQAYQRNLENRWQRGQSALATFTNRVTRPLKWLADVSTPKNVTTLEEQQAKQIHQPSANRSSKIGRLIHDARVDFTARRLAYQGRVRAEESRVHLRPEAVKNLPKDELLRRLAEGRLALTRQDRRAINWNDPRVGSKDYQINIYKELIASAVKKCTPTEIAEACRRADKWAAVHLGLSFTAGVAGFAAGYVGVNLWRQHNSAITQEAASSASRPAEAPTTSASPTAPTVPSTPVAPVTPTVPTEYAEHLARAKQLAAVGAGHFEGDKFVLTAPHQIDAQGNEWIVAGGHHLKIVNGVTDTSALDASATLQHEMTGHNLAEQYAPGADQATIDEAIKIKDVLANHLVEQQLHGTGSLAPDVQQQLSSAGYDFDLSDMKSTGDVRGEIHQAMAKWFEQHQPKPVAAPVAHWSKAPVDNTLPHLPKAQPQLEQSLFNNHSVKPKVEPVITPQHTDLPIKGDTTVTEPKPAEYEGWHLPLVKDTGENLQVHTPDATPVVEHAVQPQMTATHPVEVVEPMQSAPVEAPVAPVHAPVTQPDVPAVAPRVNKVDVLDDYFTGNDVKVTAKDLEEVVAASKK